MRVFNWMHIRPGIDSLEDGEQLDVEHLGIFVSPFETGSESFSSKARDL